MRAVNTQRKQQIYVNEHIAKLYAYINIHMPIWVYKHRNKSQKWAAAVSHIYTQVRML